MGEVAVQAENQLEILLGLMPGARLHRMSQGRPSPPHEILPAGIDVGDAPKPKTHAPLPALTVTRGGRKVTLEFSPAPKPDNWWMSLYVSARSPVPVTVTAVQTAGFTRPGLVPMQRFKTGDPRFDEIYEAMSTDTDQARALLEATEGVQRILAMGEIERLTLETRFVRLIRLLNEFSDIEAQGLKQTIDEMVRLGQDLEAAAASQPGRG